ncbi:MAG: DUF2147 domain-containing protein [Devosia sp.]
MLLNNTIAALALTLCSIAPALAENPTPVGTWQTSSGESRFAVSLCGDGTELCAKLTWLRDDARSPENLAQLNKFVIRHAKPTAANQWQGAVTYEGHTVDGSVTLVSQNHLSMRGCQFIACKQVEFNRL